MDPRAGGGGAQDKEIPFPPCGSERVTDEPPVTASGKHESVLARGGGMGTQNCKLVLCFSLIYTPFRGGGGGWCLNPVFWEDLGRADVRAGLC